MVGEEELPGPPEIVYPLALKAIRELLRLTTSGGGWVDVLDGDIELFEENRQVTPTLFYTASGTLPDITLYRSNGHTIEPEQEPWANACLNTLIWLGEVAGKRMGPPRRYGLPLFAPRASTAHCPGCGREYMYRVRMNWMAATAWAHRDVPRLLVEAGPVSTARRSLDWAEDEECTATLANVEELLARQGIQVTEDRVSTWPRSKCPACGAILGTRTWTVEGTPLRLFAGEVGD
jgi:hypothetical protein